MTELTPNTTGLILNGQIHLLVKTNDEEVCTNCSIRDFCADMTHLPCVMLSDSNDDHFRNFPEDCNEQEYQEDNERSI